MGLFGSEPPAEPLEKAKSAAMCSHFVAHGGQIEPDLQVVIDAWPTLPESVKAASWR